MIAFIAFGLSTPFRALSQTTSRLKGLEAIEVFMVTTPKEFLGQPDVPKDSDLREIVIHRLSADKVPIVSFLAVANDPAKLNAYQAKKKGQLIVEVQLVRSGGAFAYNVTTQVVEDGRIARTGASILAPVWSRSMIGFATAPTLFAALRDRIVDEADELAADFLKVNPR